MAADRLLTKFDLKEAELFEALGHSTCIGILLMGARSTTLGLAKMESYDNLI
ncbi:MAG: hypothetical protein ACPLZF_06540 [Nitrososphaeria archaeon]